jgi:hypothetical protein
MVSYITTGAQVPEGANSVVKVEDTTLENGNLVRITVDVNAGENVRQIGSDIRSPSLLLPPLPHIITVQESSSSLLEPNSVPRRSDSWPQWELLRYLFLTAPLSQQSRSTGTVPPETHHRSHEHWR